jgi:hypothetical protein
VIGGPLRLLLVLSVVATAAVAGELRFSDMTAASGVDFKMTSGESPSRAILEVNGGGVALFDYDGDGDLDLFLANGATMAAPEKGPGSRLYANAGEGRFTDVTQQVGISLTRWAMGVAVADYDGDGADDLYVACYGKNVLLRNDVERSGKFVDVTDAAGVGDGRWGASAAFGDIDGDGDPDLYVTNYLVFDAAEPPSRDGRMFMGVQVMAGPNGLQPEHDVLYENLGNGKFRDVTVASGCKPERPGYGLGVLIFDANLDGRQDIFVGNDSTENFLFVNKGGGKFEERGVVSGIASNYDGGTQATMGIGLGDVDANGYPDLFTTNFSSDTNTLHLNLDGKFFDDRTSQFGLAMVSRPFLGWGTGFYDFDGDGDEDLFTANGHVYPEARTVTMDSEYRQPPLLFERAGRRFRPATGAGKIFDTPYPGRSTAFGDLDGDGDVDVVMTTLNDKVQLFRNDTGAHPVVVVELRGASGSRFAHGSRVELLVGERVQRRWLSGGSYQSVDAPQAFFALPGGTKGGLKLRVTWPDGTVQELDGIPVDRRVIVKRGSKKLQAEPLRGRPQSAGSHASTS